MTASPTFQPAWWLPNPHLQTLWSPFFRRGPTLERQRERLWLADGDFIDLDWAGPHDAETPLVLALHGLTGSSSSHYILGLQRALLERGWASVALNWRGCSGEPNRLPRGYHSGVSDDLAEVVAHLRARRPQAPLYAVGYSLGCDVLLKYLGDNAGDCPLHGLALIPMYETHRQHE
ncbi:YheT family hydrolase, partial [Pseudomonas aeruginosa]